MNDYFSRRRLLVVGSVALLAGCVARSQTGGASPAGVGLWYDSADGDTLSSLSRRSGLSVDAIVSANNLSSSRLTPRTRLWLPGVSHLRADPLAGQDADAVTSGPQGRENDAHEPDPNDVPAPPPGGYVLVPRSAWTSQAVGTRNNAMGVVSRITLHHTGEHDGMIGLPDVEVIRRIEKYHRNERHWAAIGYHYIVGRDGRIYEGRPAKFQGAHVLSENANNLGISVVGDFQQKLPNDRQLAALRAFLNDERDKYRVPKTRVYGHRDLNTSICPGDALYGWLKTKYKQS